MPAHRVSQWLSSLRIRRHGLPAPVTPAAYRPNAYIATIPAIANERYDWNLLAAMARNSSAVAMCIARYLTAYTEPRLIVVDAQGRELPNHPAARLFNRPNPSMSGRKMLRLALEYRLIGGQSYLVKEYKFGRLAELYPYTAGDIQPVPGVAEWLDGYIFRARSPQQQTLALSEVAALQWPVTDPTAPWLGLSPLQQIALEVETDTEATRYLLSLLKNDAATGLHVDVGAINDEAEFKRIAEQMRADYTGRGRGQLMVTANDAKVTRVSLSLKDMAFDTVRKVPETRIAGVFMLPVELVKLSAGLEKSTYNNVAEARRSWTQDTLIPMWEADADELTAAFRGDFPGDWRFQFDTSNVAALSDNRNDAVTRAVAAVGAGIMTTEEARIEIGLDPVPADAITALTRHLKPTNGHA